MDPFVPTEVGEPGEVCSSGVARHLTRVWRAPVSLRALSGLPLTLPTAQYPMAVPAGCQVLPSKVTKGWCPSSTSLLHLPMGPLLSQAQLGPDLSLSPGSVLGAGAALDVLVPIWGCGTNPDHQALTCVLRKGALTRASTNCFNCSQMF